MGSFMHSAPLWVQLYGKKLLKYLKATRGHSMWFKGQGTGIMEDRQWVLEAYGDASLEADYSQTGTAIFLGGDLVDWRSTKQQQPARSTCEAEVTALASTNLALEGIETVVNSLGIDVGTPLLMGDNTASIFLARGSGSWRTKTLSNRAAGLRDRVERKTVDLRHVASGDQRADGLTKQMSGANMARVRDHFGLRALT